MMQRLFKITFSSVEEKRVKGKKSNAYKEKQKEKWSQN